MPQYFHSDQGSEYQSEEHADFLARLGVTVSMSRKGSPWENGRQESFFSHYKLALENKLIDKIGGIYDVNDYLKERLGEEVSVCW